MASNKYKCFSLAMVINSFNSSEVVVKGFSHTNILFDCIVPFEKEHTEESLKDYLMKEIIPEKEIYYYVIQIDRPYTA